MLAVDGDLGRNRSLQLQYRFPVFVRSLTKTRETFSIPARKGIFPYGNGTFALLQMLYTFWIFFFIVFTKSHKRSCAVLPRGFLKHSSPARKPSSWLARDHTKKKAVLTGLFFSAGNLAYGAVHLFLSRFVSLIGTWKTFSIPARKARRCFTRAHTIKKAWFSRLFFIRVISAGIEPASQLPQSCVLSIERRDQI